MKAITFFVINFVLFLFVAFSGHVLSKNTKINALLNIFIMGLVLSVAITLVYNYGCKSEGFSNYRTTDTVEDSSGWEITPAKKCCGVNLNWLDKNSDRYRYCSNPSNQGNIAAYCCQNGNCGCKGFVGKPVYFQYTPESNAMWENERCSEPMNAGLMPPIL